MTNCRWQTVPHDWPGHRERSVAKFRPCTSQYVEQSTESSLVGASCQAEPIACRIIVAVGVYRIGQVVKTHTGNSGNMPYLSPILPAGTEFCKILQKDRNSMETGKFCGSAYNSACRRNLWSPFIKYLAIECKYKYHYPHVR